MKTYPMIGFLLKHQRVLPIAAVALILLMFGYTAARTGIPEIAVAGVVFSGVAYVLAKSYLELVEVISDMLLPK